MSCDGDAPILPAKPFKRTISFPSNTHRLAPHQDRSEIPSEAWRLWCLFTTAAGHWDDDKLANGTRLLSAHKHIRLLRGCNCCFGHNPSRWDDDETIFQGSANGDLLEPLFLLLRRLFTLCHAFQTSDLHLRQAENPGYRLWQCSI